MTAESRPVRAVIYARVSTDGQTTLNQVSALKAVCQARGWTLVDIYEDQGISGTKGREGRPALDKMLKDAVRARFDVVLIWAPDRLARSVSDLIASLRVLEESKVDLFIHSHAVDTSTPAGKALFQMLGVFGEFEVGMIRDRVKAGISRAREKGTKSGKPIGRPKISPEKEDEVAGYLRSGLGMSKAARMAGVGSSAVQRIAREIGHVPGRAAA